MINWIKRREKKNEVAWKVFRLPCRIFLPRWFAYVGLIYLYTNVGTTTRRWYDVVCGATNQLLYPRGEFRLLGMSNRAIHCIVDIHRYIYQRESCVLKRVIEWTERIQWKCPAQVSRGINWSNIWEQLIPPFPWSLDHSLSLSLFYCTWHTQFDIRDKGRATSRLVTCMCAPAHDPRAEADGPNHWSRNERTKGLIKRER